MNRRYFFYIFRAVTLITTFFVLCIYCHEDKASNNDQQSSPYAIDDYASMVREARTWPLHDFDDAMRAMPNARSITLFRSVSGIDGTKFMELCRSLFNRYNPSLLLPRKSPTIPKIIHQIWVGGNPPEELLAYAQTVQKLHEDRGWQYKLWRDDDVKQIQLFNQDLYDQTQNFGIKADLLRFELLYRYGGVYLDMDCECIKPLDELHYRYDLYVGLQPLDAKVLQLGIGVIGAKPAHPLIARYIKTVRENWHRKGPIMKSGPIPFTKCFFQCAGRHGSKDIAFPPLYFYPLETQVHLAESDASIKQKRLEQWIKQGSYTIHYWAGSWMPSEQRRPKFRSIKNDENTQEWNS